LERDDVQETLQAVDSLGDFDLLSLTSLELLIVGIADDNWLARTSNDWEMLVTTLKLTLSLEDIPC